MLVSLPLEILREVWNILLDSSVFILSGILIAGLLKVVLNPDVILHHLGRGKVSSVIKAALFGVPLPL
jgi:uncharacterized membrane protein YraQ (UPF0718 family)